MIELRQGTSFNLKIGPYSNSTDGVTAETGLTIAQSDILLSKNGGDYAQKNESTTCTHDARGWYTCPINTTDTGTLGSLQLEGSKSGACPVFHEYMVVTANYYDTKYGTGYFDVNVVSQDNIDFGALQKASLNDATPAVTVSDKTGFSLSAAGVDAVWDEVVTAHTTSNTAGENLNIITDMLTGKMTNIGATITHYKQDGVSIRKQFTKDNATAPTSRTPV